MHISKPDEHTSVTTTPTQLLLLPLVLLVKLTAMSVAMARHAKTRSVNQNTAVPQVFTLLVLTAEADCCSSVADGLRAYAHQHYQSATVSHQPVTPTQTTRAAAPAASRPCCAAPRKLT